jgi:hypothetical protein
MDELKKAQGKFASSLLRNSSKIKEDRAITIFRNAERFYKRKVEDLEARIQDLETERDSQLDMSPTDINSLVLASDFNAEKFYDTDMKLTLEIREANIKLEEARKRYNELFTNAKLAPAPAPSEA